MRARAGGDAEMQEPLEEDDESICSEDSYEYDCYNVDYHSTKEYD